MTTQLGVVDCGDNSCMFAVNKGGMRTNGGCRCFRDAMGHADYRELRYWVQLTNQRHKEELAAAEARGRELERQAVVAYLEQQELAAHKSQERAVEAALYNARLRISCGVHAGGW